jgi:hypothetical protein
MTANENREADRPAWAVGLDLSPKLPRGTEGILEICVKLRPESGWLLRRLADAEMEAARLKDALITLEEEWSALTGMTLREAIEQAHGRVEHEEPYSLVDYFAEKLGAGRGEPDFLIDVHGHAWSLSEDGRYVTPGGVTSRSRSMIEEFHGPVTEVWA